MKKILSFVLIISVLFLLTGCNQTEFEKAIKKFSNYRSITISEVENNPNYGQLTSKFFIDGDYIKENVLGAEYYIVKDDDAYYAYVQKDGETWSKIEASEDDINYVLPPISEFQEADFTYDSSTGWYTAKGNYGVNGEYRQIILRIYDNTLTNMSFYYIEDGVMYEFDVTLSDYNSTNVTLPEVS